MSWEVWGTPPDPEPQLCPICDQESHAEGCDLGAMQTRAVNAEQQRNELLDALAAINAVEHVLPFGNLCDCIQCQFVRARSAAIAKATATAPQEGS